MKILPLILAAIGSTIVFGCGDKEAGAEPSLPPVISKAALDWSGCRAVKVNELIATVRTAVSIVDQAFQECSGFEAETIRVWKAEYGPNSEQQVIQLRERWRSGLVETVNSLRNGTPVADTFGAWGQCVGRNLPNVIPNNADANSIANRAFAACTSELEAIRSDISQKYGAGRAESDVAALHSSLRAQAIMLIEARRQR